MESQAMPKGYIYADFRVTDPERWRAYVALTQESLVGTGARYVVRGGDGEALEGDLEGRGVAILEFESRDAARAWYDSPRYQAAKAARLGAGDVTVLLLSGPEG
jgi:uncharacterized protein (DUF1330 family)